MSHQAGLTGFRSPDSGPDGKTMEHVDIYDHDKACAQLAKQKPFWEPGTKNGYHALTIGWLAGELVRRTTGQSIGNFFRENVAEKLGVDFHIGTPDSEHHRCVPMSPAPVAAAAGGGAGPKDDLTP